MNYLTADFGSTYTKLTAISEESGKIIASACAFTTIETNILEGFNEALKLLEQAAPGFKYDKLLCCSSAGGGLKMVALGLVPELTSKAAKMAASNAGAKVVKTYAYEISAQEQGEIFAISPDLVLLCGGTDGGNKETVINNARLLKDIKRNFAIIYAGNKSAARDIEEILQGGNKEFVITDNVMPVFNQINIQPAQNAIRDLFIKNIIAAKGLSQAQAMATGEIMPTPLAVMKACELLSLGTKKTPGIGEFAAIDLGGATTDVYTMAKGEASLENVIPKGLPEPFAKRTVEGDLGMRYSLKSLAEQIDLDALAAQLNIKRAEIEAWVEKACASPDIISAPGSTPRRIDEALARQAVEIALKRHAGTLEKVFTPLGEFFTLNGKDLTRLGSVIGTGGIIINSQNPAAILEGGKQNPKNISAMLPAAPGYRLDKKYILSAAGLLSQHNQELALQILKQEIVQI